MILFETESGEQEKYLEKAVDLIEQLESQSGVDIFTLNKAMATIIERRARSKPLWQNWLCKKFEDAEGAATDNIQPLMLDLS